MTHENGPIFRPDPECVREALKRIEEEKRNFVYTPEHAQHDLEVYEDWNRWRAQMVAKEGAEETEEMIHKRKWFIKKRPLSRGTKIIIGTPWLLFVIDISSWSRKEAD